MNRQRFIPLVVVAAGLLAYCNSFTGGFFHDDFTSIPENPTIQRLWPIWQALSPPHRGELTVEGRPLINLSLAINYALGGYNVWGYHALNLTVHILAGLTLLGIVRRTLRQPALRDRFGAAANELGLATAVLWTVHPLQTESVTYIVQRAESIMGLFYLLTLYCFIRGAESPLAGNGKWFMGNGSWEPQARLWYGLSVMACALGMASKEVMVTAPVMVLLYDRAFLSGSFREAWRRRWPLYPVLAGTWILLGILAVSGQIPATLMTARRFGLDWWKYLATEPGVIVHYLRLTVWPSPLCLDPVWPIAKTWVSILPPTVVVVILLTASAWAWRWSPVPAPKLRLAWGFVGAWFFLILAPSSSFIPLHDPLYEHRMYLPLAAVVSVVVMGLYALAGRRSLVVFMAVAIGLGFLTWRRNRDYQRNPHYNSALALQKTGRLQESIAEYERALRATPDGAEIHYNLGAALEEAGRVPEAIDQLEQAVQLKPDSAVGYDRLGDVFLRLDRMPEAIGYYEWAVRTKPDYPEAHYNLGVVLMRVGRVQEAVHHLEQAVQLRSGYAEAHNSLGLALVRLGRMQEAMEHWERGVRLRPDYAEAEYNWGVALARLGRVSEAIEHWEAAVRIKPDYADAHNNLGGLFLQLGRFREAIAQFELALRVAPEMVEAHYNLGVALERAGDVANAIREYGQALRLKPDYAAAREGLVRLRAVR